MVSALRLVAPAPAALPPLLAGIDVHPVTAAQALAALRETGDRLRAMGDPRAAFPDVYAAVTANILAAIETDGTFLEPRWVDRLAGRFAEQYFEALVPALSGEAPRSAAWRVATRTGRVALPVREALLGVNAHVNFDLALGIVDAIRCFPAPDERLLARYHADHEAVNRVLAASIADIQATLRDRHGCPAARIATRSRTLERLTAGVFLHLVVGWRTRVWGDVLALLAAPTPAAEQALIAAMDARAGRYALRMAGPLARAA